MRPERSLRWQNAAFHDLEKTHSHLAQHSPDAAVRFAEMILEASEQLLLHPEMGPPAIDLHPSDRYRSLIRGHHRLIYRIEDDVIWLLRVWDTRQDPQELKAEEDR